LGGTLGSLACRAGGPVPSVRGKRRPEDAVVSRCLRVAVAVALFAALARPRSPAADPPPSADAIARTVHELGADDYRVREQATAKLWAAGPAAEEALKAGLKSADAEVVARCRDLLDKIPYGITPDMPRRFLELIAAARSGGPGGWPNVAPDLLDLGPRGLEVANKLIERIAGNDGQRDAMRRTLELEGWRVAPALLAAGQTDKAAGLLERSAVLAAAGGADPIAVRNYGACLAVRGRLGEQLPRWREAAAPSPGPAPGAGEGRTVDRQAGLVILATLARLHGDLAEARQAAEQTGDRKLKEAVYFDQAAWTDLAALPPPEDRDAPIGIGLKAIYFTAAGKPAEAQAALAELKALPVARTSSVAPPLVFRALMYAGQPADAVAALDKYKQLDGLLPQFEVLCQQHRYAEAFAKLEKPVVEHSPIRWQWDAAKLRTYQECGERDKFRQTLAALSAYDTLTPAEATAAQTTVELLVGLDRTVDALPIAAAMLNGAAPPADVFGKLYPKAPLAAEVWWRYERVQRPDEPMRVTVAKLPARLDKRLAEPEGRSALEAAAKVARTQPPADADRWLQGLAQACQAAGLDEPARVYAREAAEKTNSAAAWLRLGDLHAEAKQYADAAAAYERSWQADLKEPLPLWLRGWALDKAGRPGGREARELARTLPLGNEDTRNKFADELVNRIAYGPEMRDAAREEWRLVLRLSKLDSATGRNAERLLAGDRGAYPDRLAAADADRRFLVRLLRGNTYFLKNQSYLVVLHRVHRDRAEGLLAKGDVAGAVREAETAQSLLPGGDEPIAALVPELTKRGHAAEADRLYKAAADVQDRLCKDYPQSAEFRNNRAWLAARCKRDLDTAAEFARKAVALEPAHINYRETLAEVLFQKGDKPAALAEIKRCVEAEPKNSYFAKQQARMEAGDPNAPLPER
jgi:tetratricopeptide (TPR) repeat protein